MVITTTHLLETECHPHYHVHMLAMDQLNGQPIPKEDIICPIRRLQDYKAMGDSRNHQHCASELSLPEGMSHFQAAS